MGAVIVRALSPWFGRLVQRPPRDRIAALTGISREKWRELAKAFPGLPRDPGPLAARARARLARLASRALATGRWAARREGEPLDPQPAVYVTAHIGALQALRYALRARGVPAASVIGPFNLDRTEATKADRVFDRRHGLEFPHSFPSTKPHRLKSALASGSLILAADLPEGRAFEAVLLGAPVRLDPRPFRLARAAKVACRPAFLTLPKEGWTLTVGERLPADERSAVAGFARLFAEVAARAPLDLDGLVYWNLTRGCR